MTRKAGLVQRQRLAEEQRTVTLAAFRGGTETLPRDPVDRIAGGADNVKRFGHGDDSLRLFPETRLDRLESTSSDNYVRRLDPRHPIRL
ncbi:hypothetical protein THIOKS11710059 [Thiocapsa sp. KS1]|nr:hypothetical protein THIOKS11710059 [Thiocapsa sp. KS1]